MRGPGAHCLGIAWIASLRTLKSRSLTSSGLRRKYAPHELRFLTRVSLRTSFLASGAQLSRNILSLLKVTAQKYCRPAMVTRVIVALLVMLTTPITRAWSLTGLPRAPRERYKTALSPRLIRPAVFEDHFGNA